MAAPPSVAPTVAVAPETAVERSPDIASAAADAIEPELTTVEERMPVAPVDDIIAKDAGVSNEDLTLFGGLAAAFVCQA